MKGARHGENICLIDLFHDLEVFVVLRFDSNTYAGVRNCDIHSSDCSVKFSRNRNELISVGNITGISVVLFTVGSRSDKILNWLFSASNQAKCRPARGEFIG